MTLRPAAPLAVAVVLTAPSSLWFARPAHATNRFSGVSIDDSRADEGCGGLRVTFGREPALLEESTHALPAGQPARIAVEDGGSLRVRGGKSRSVEVTACRFGADAAAIARLKVDVDGSSVTARGAGRGDATIVLLVAMPKGASLDLSAENGPVSVHGVDGSVKLEATNGPLSVKDLHGSLDATVANGPVTIRGGSGSYKVRATNGPLDVRLAGASWDGGVLEAETVNGPLTLALDAGFRSPLRLTGGAWTPLSCRASACDGARRTEDDDTRTIEIGSGEPVVRLSATNGPVTVRDASR